MSEHYTAIAADHFDDWSEMLDAVDKRPAHPDWESRSSRGTADANWYGSPSWDAMMEIARDGWPAGRARMVAGLEKANLLTRNIGRPAINYDVAGAYPVVPLAVAGEPACMANVGETAIAARPIVRIWLPRSASAVVDPRYIENYGIAALSVIDALENEGRSVELTILQTCRSGSLLHDTRLIAKRAGEPMDLDRLAFILAHPSFLRRVCFATYEWHGGQFHEKFWPSYGFPCRLPESMVEPGVNYLPGIDCGNLTPWQTLESAVHAMERLIRPGIAEVEDRDGAA